MNHIKFLILGEKKGKKNKRDERGIEEGGGAESATLQEKSTQNK